MSATYDVLTMGRSCIDLYAHQIGVPITEVTSFDAYVGGCPTNISVGTRRLGLRSALLTAVGEDQVADFVLAFLNREGVDTRFIPRKPGRRTSAVIMAIQPPDKFPLTFYREGCADRELTTDDVARAPVAESAIVLVTGTGLSHEPSRTATLLRGRSRSGVGFAALRRRRLPARPMELAVCLRGIDAAARQHGRARDRNGRGSGGSRRRTTTSSARSRTLLNVHERASGAEARRAGRHAVPKWRPHRRAGRFASTC